MFNEKIHAFPLLDVYEKLKKYKRADKGHRERLRTMLNHYGMSHKIKEWIADNDSKSPLWRTCVQLEESLWESIRMMLSEHGYDPSWIRWKGGKAGMDVIFERQDPEGILPLLKDGKWGVFDDSDSYIAPKYDELLIQSEEYIRARIGDEWGWITFEGDLTLDQEMAFYGSWMDASR